MTKHVVITKENGRVENVVKWDGVTPYSPGDDLALVSVSDDVPVSKGDLYDGKAFTPALHPDVPVLELSSSSIAQVGRDAIDSNQVFLDKFDAGTLTSEDVVAQVASLTVDQMKLIRFFLSLKLFGGDGITNDGQPLKDPNGPTVVG